MRSHAVRILYYDLSLVFCNIFESFLLFWYFMDSPSKAFFQDFVKWVRSGTGLSYMYVGLSNCWLCRYAFKLYLFCILSRDLKKKKQKTKALYGESSSRCLLKFWFTVQLLIFFFFFLFFAFLLLTLLVRLAALVLLSAFCLLLQLLSYHLFYKMWLHQVVFIFIFIFLHDKWLQSH